MKKINQFVAGTAVIALAFLFAGCQSMEDYRNERAEYAIRHFEGAKYRELVEGKKLTLRECVELAQKHNLDLQVNKLEEKVAREFKTAEMLGMLPELNVNDTATFRNNTAASSSEKVGEDGLTYGYSKSQDRNSISKWSSYTRIFLITSSRSLRSKASLFRISWNTSIASFAARLTRRMVLRLSESISI